VETLIEKSWESGIFAVLFIISSATFLAYIKKMIEDVKKRYEAKETYIQKLINDMTERNESREKLYIETIHKNQDIIQNLSDALKCIDDISDDIKNIQKCLAERK
jgi:RAB protein geranylgeranyltransferase component A